MKKIILWTLFIFLPTIGMAEPDDFGIWSYVQTKYNFTKRLYGSTHFEYRSKQNTSRTDCFIIRQYLGYELTSWLKTDIAYDYITSPTTQHNRYLFSITASHNEGNFSVSLRERYLYDYKLSQHSGENVLRSKATFNYHIPGTKLSPYLAYEIFTWSHWDKTRQYAGTLWKLDSHSTLDLFYMYYTKANNPIQQHLLGAGYILNF